MALNTLRLYEKFKTRFDEETSHLLVESLEEVATQLQIPPIELLATKEDLRELRQELLGEIGKVRQEMGEMRVSLRQEMGEMRVSLIKWMVSLVFIHLAAVLAVMSLVVVLLKGG